MWIFKLLNGGHVKRFAEVNSKHALKVSLVPDDILPEGTRNENSFFSGSLGQYGVDSTTNQNIVGSAASPIRFYIGSSEEYDIYIMQIVILLTDSSIALQKFGAIDQLTNGFYLGLREEGVETDLILNAKTSGELFVKAGDDYRATLTNYTGTTDAQQVKIDLSKYIPGGFRIGRGSQDKIYSLVKDNLTGLNVLEVQCFGYKKLDIL